MSDIFFKELEIRTPDYHLGIGGGSHGRNTGRMLELIEKVLVKERPDWVLVYGDTDSTLAGALAATNCIFR
jgi:UDP-GlcNAc3NAcA epimerase